MAIDDFLENMPGHFVEIEEGLTAFIPTPLPPEIPLDFELFNLLESAAKSLAQLNGLSQTFLKGPFLRREALISSSIEGTVTGLTELAVYEADSTLEEAKDVKEVRNNHYALGEGLRSLEETDRGITIGLIRQLHHDLLSGVRGRDKHPGEFRNQQAFIVNFAAQKRSEARFVPPPAVHVGPCMEKLVEYINQDETDIPFLIKVALVHYQFETIHPFADGNGRMGRILIPLMLSKGGWMKDPLLYLSGFFAAHDREYKDLMLRVSQKADWLSWIKFFLRGITVQAQDGVERARRLHELKEHYYELCGRLPIGANLMKLVDLLFWIPAITISGASSAIDVTYPTAKKYVTTLEELGVIEEYIPRERSSIYLAKEIVRLSES
jgi:cell filamentation protein, protein adenylyltransferase